MKLLRSLILSIGFLSTSSWAAPSEISVLVKGMVCSFCGQGITKKFKALPEVNDVKVDMDSHTVKIILKEGKTLNDETIDKTLKDAGYNVESIKRN